MRSPVVSGSSTRSGSGTAQAIASVAFKASGVETINSSADFAAKNRDNSRHGFYDSNHASVNSEYAYNMDYSAPGKTTSFSETFQNSYINQAVNSSINIPGNYEQAASKPGNNLVAWLGLGAKAGSSSGAEYSVTGSNGILNNTNGGTVGGIEQHDGSNYKSETLRSSYLDKQSQVATLNASLASQYACSSTSTGMGASYTVAQKMKEGATLGQAMNSTHGEKWRMGGNQTMNRTGAELADSAGSAENPATFAVALVADHSGPRFVASGNTLKEIAKGAGVPESNIKIATSMGQYNQFMKEAAEANQAIVNQMRADGKLGADEKFGGVILVHHAHGYANGNGPEAHSGSTFGGEDSIEKPIIQAKIKGEFAWAAAMHGCCHSGGFEGKVKGMEASAEDAEYQAKGTEINDEIKESGSKEFAFS